jgi:CHAT domain-containing protein/Tfp pilus assembly protein PilF
MRHAQGDASSEPDLQDVVQVKRGPSALAWLAALFLVLQAFGQPAGRPSPPESSEGQSETGTADNSLYSLAKAALQQGDLDGAEKYFQESLSISEKVAPGSLAVARSLNGLGDVAQQRGRPLQAEAYYQQALAILHKLDPSSADAANSLDGLARAAYDRGDVAKFDDYTLQAFTIRQKLDSDSLDFAASLNSMAAVHNHRGQGDQAEESYKKALSIQERLAPKSLVLAQTLANLGGSLFMRRQYDEAGAYHQRALTIREQLAPGSLAVATSLRWLGMCAIGKGPQEQERYYRAALTIEEKLAPGSVDVATTLGFLSAAAQDRGDLTAGADYGSQALALWEKLAPGSRKATVAMADLSNLLLERGDLAEAEGLARKALEQNRKVDPDSKYVAGDLWLLGKIAMGRGNLAPAEDYYRQALAIGERLDPGGSMSARVMRELGLVAEWRGDLAKAEEYYRNALAIWQKTSPGGNTLAQGLFGVGMVLHERGDLAQAEGYYRRALAIWEETVPDTLYVAQVLGRLGEVARSQGDLARAEEYQRRAIAIEQKSAPGGLDLAHGLSDLGEIRLAQGELSEALQYQQQALAIREKLAPGTGSHATSLSAVAGIMCREGKPDAAAQYYQRALDAMENQAARLGSGDELRAGFRSRRAKYYKDYIDLLVEQKRFELAFQVLERFRARTLLETLAGARAEIRKGADPALLEQKRGLQQSLAAKTQRRIELLGAKNGGAELAVLDKEIQNLHSQYQEVEGRIRASSPGYAALMHPQPLSAKEAQEQLLDEDTVLLEYSLGEERSYVWVLTRGSLTTYELPKRSDIEEVAREIYRLLTARGEIHTQESAAQLQARMDGARQTYRDQAAILSRMVLEPVAGQIENKKRLLIVSDGALQYIPFAALPTPQTTTAGQEGRAAPLLMTHEIVNLPSASVLAALRQPIERKKPSKEIAVLADPVFTKGDARVSAGRGSSVKAVHDGAEEASSLRSASTEQLARVVADVPAATRGGAYLGRLPYSRLEAQAILSLVPSRQGMQALDFRASRATALSPDLAQYRILHFATHGLLDSEHPELSGLVFSLVDSRGQPQYGFLGLDDVYNMNLNADLVVLSACNTGLGREIQGEGLVGLTQGFMYAGAPQIVASLWSVNDAATAELMGRFYQAMEQKKMSPAAALRQAQIQILKQKRWHDPYYWAGFVIHGDGR